MDLAGGQTYGGVTYQTFTLFLPIIYRSFTDTLPNFLPS